MTQDEQSNDKKSNAKPRKNFVLWALICIFILASMGVMFAADYYYAPDAKSSNATPGAVDD